MFRLRDLKNGMFQIHKTNSPAFEGTPYSIFTQAVKMGVLQKELMVAVNKLHESKDDYADFNDYGRLIKTEKDRR